MRYRTSITHLSHSARNGYNPLSPIHFSQESTMERELIDRADNIRKRILQLRDSL